MVLNLDPETVAVLQKYADGALTVTDLAAWLASAEYDQDLPLVERDELARVGLVVHESMEQLRPVEEVREAVQELLSLAAVDAKRRSA